MAHESESETKKDNKETSQEVGEGLALLVTSIKREPKSITDSRQVVFRAIREKPSLVST